MQNLIWICLTFDAISVRVLWASARGECIAFSVLSKMIFFGQKSANAAIVGCRHTHQLKQLIMFIRKTYTKES